VKSAATGHSASAAVDQIQWQRRPAGALPSVVSVRPRGCTRCPVRRLPRPGSDNRQRRSARREDASSSKATFPKGQRRHHTQGRQQSTTGARTRWGGGPGVCTPCVAAPPFSGLTLPFVRVLSHPWLRVCLAVLSSLSSSLLFLFTPWPRVVLPAAGQWATALSPVVQLP
jgi:hypothetical protein